MLMGGVGGALAGAVAGYASLTPPLWLPVLHGTVVAVVVTALSLRYDRTLAEEIESGEAGPARRRRGPDATP